MQHIEVSVPKNAKALNRRNAATLALTIGHRGDKIPARLVAGNVTKVRGTTLICLAEVAKDRNQKGEVIDVLFLRPTNKKKPSAGTPYRDANGKIVIPTLQ